MTTSPSTVRLHETRATPGLSQNHSGYKALKQTSVHFPVELATKLRMRAVEGEISRLGLIRAVLEHWVRRRASFSPEKLRSDTIRLLAVQDGRKPRGKHGETQLVSIYLSVETHAQVKQFAEIAGGTMRGIIIGILQEWVRENCE
ncbi:MAG: hypothetical protein OXG94_10950 [Bacteroidetes bacterium]|nr:hypothetical protein [Bacteroidota bacterium]